uniref:Putative secreted protein n=1 Tax=Anopheles triannulatus TaxID=58253 RepID=A0A2M4B2A1_9DIPT
MFCSSFGREKLTASMICLFTSSSLSSSSSGSLSSSSTSSSKIGCLYASSSKGVRCRWTSWGDTVTPRTPLVDVVLARITWKIGGGGGGTKCDDCCWQLAARVLAARYSSIRPRVAGEVAQAKSDTLILFSRSFSSSSPIASMVVGIGDGITIGASECPMASLHCGPSDKLAISGST